MTRFTAIIRIVTGHAPHGRVVAVDVGPMQPASFDDRPEKTQEETER